VKLTKILAAAVIAVSLMSSGCGTSDYVQSVTLTSNGASAGGFFNLVGADGTLQLVVTANYHSGKSVPVTDSATYSVTVVGCQASATEGVCGAAIVPYDATPAPAPISSTGLMTAVAAQCTWFDVGTPPPTPPEYNWVYTGYYQVVATYAGIQSQPVAVGVGSLAGNAPNGACGPQ